MSLYIPPLLEDILPPLKDTDLGPPSRVLKRKGKTVAIWDVKVMVAFP